MVFPRDAFDTFLHVSNFFYKIAFCLGEKQGSLVNDNCNSWYNRVGDFEYQVGIGEQFLYTDKLACVIQQINPTPPGVRGQWHALSAMRVECEQFTYLFIFISTVVN